MQGLASESGNYRLLIGKLDRFIRKYYVNRMIKGSLYSTALIVGSFLCFTLAEHYFYFGTSVRQLLQWSFVLMTLGALGFWVVVPALSYMRLGKMISHEYAAEIIGSHFGNVRDKLLNILQLNSQVDHAASRELLVASIDQKTQEIAPVAFQNAIDLRRNRQYLPYALPPLLLLLGILVGAPSLIKDPAHRILHSRMHFEREAPFYFKVLNECLEVPQYDDYTLSVEVEGTALPEQAFITINGFQYRMKKESTGSYTYAFNNVQSNQNFHFSSQGVESAAYELMVLKKPSIVQFEVKLEYPSYLDRKSETLSNVGDLVVPVGTKLSWLFNSLNTTQLSYALGADTSQLARQIDTETFSFDTRARRSMTYKMWIGNEVLPLADSILYSLAVVPDLYPTVELKVFDDSTNHNVTYLVGDASDDHGLTEVYFHQQHLDAKGEIISVQSELLKKTNAKNETFDYVFDAGKFSLKPGESVSYFVEVWDNDGVHGRKSTRSTVMQFKQPTKEEFLAMENKNDEAVKKALEEGSNEAEDIRKQAKELRDKMLQEKHIDWQLKKEWEDLLERQKQLENEIKEAQQKFQENLANQQAFEQTPEEIQEKQEKLQELFDKLAEDETRELMEKIQQLLQELNRDEALQMMEEMDVNQQELSMELERLKELFKQLELERDVNQLIDQLNELAEKQEQLAEETAAQEQQTEQGKTDAETEQQELTEQQENINEAFENLMQDLEKLEERNQDLKAPKNIGDNQEKSDEIKEDLDKSMEQLQQKENKKASESQKGASEKMKQMAQQMQEQMQDGEMQQMGEDLKAMRQLLENLLDVSFEQEELIDQINKTHTSTPEFVDQIQLQNRLRDNFGLIKDSLVALSQRVFQIESFVLEKVGEIESQMSKAMPLLEDRKKAQASDHQHRIMKNVNDLALMFAESMSQMQQQMAQQMAGMQMCTKPGGQSQDGKGMPMDKISEGQQQLNEEMQKMREGMQDGNEGSSKEFAQMAARQAALRKALNDIQKMKQAQGQGMKEMEEILEEMDKIETQLVNKRLTTEMLRRQQEILTRLLESERAEREQEYDNERISRTGDYVERSLPPSVEEYIRQREAQIEPFRTVSPTLKPYYRELLEEYYKSLKLN